MNIDRVYTSKSTKTESGTRMLDLIQERLDSWQYSPSCIGWTESNEDKIFSLLKQLLDSASYQIWFKSQGVYRTLAGSIAVGFRADNTVIIVTDTHQLIIGPRMLEYTIISK